MDINTIFSLKKNLGKVIFNLPLYPPPYKKHALDYSHGYLYEELFCEESSDIEGALSIAKGLKTSPILDLCGGAGRLSKKLAEHPFFVTLLDKSFHMLEHAKIKLKPFSNVSILQQDILNLNLNIQFPLIFCMNHGLEHLKPKQLLPTLKKIRSSLTPKGKFLFDTHHWPYWEKTDYWNQNIWRYHNDIILKNKHVRIWQKTKKIKKGSILNWSHCASSDLVRGHLMETELSIISLRTWCSLIQKAGFKIEGIYGNWQLENKIHSKLVFQLSI